MNRGEDLRRLTSLRSVATKLVDFTLATFDEQKPERVQHEFWSVRHAILLAIADRRPVPVHASILEIADDGELYLPELAWSGPAIQEDWPGPMRLQVEGESFAEPGPEAGMAAYCVWSNISGAGVKGLAVIHDISHPSLNIEFLCQETPDPDDDCKPWHSHATIPKMYMPGTKRKHGSAVSAPIFVRSVNGQPTRKRCVGVLNVTHREKEYFARPDNYLWAQECATLVGLLYSLCRDRLTATSGFTSWKDVDEAIQSGSSKPPGAKPLQAALDVDALWLDVTNVQHKKRDEFARDLGVSYKTVQNFLNRRKCSMATAELLVKYMHPSEPVTALQKYIRPPTAK